MLIALLRAEWCRRSGSLLLSMSYVAVSTNVIHLRNDVGFILAGAPFRLTLIFNFPSYADADLYIFEGVCVCGGGLAKRKHGGAM